MIASVERLQTEPPARFALCQNDPNPFNAGTTIRFSLPQVGVVSPKIVNSKGEEVARLIKGALQSGNYEVSWHAANVPSGTCFYRLSMGNWVERRKLVLLR